jgi:hypothetical protein
LLAARPQRTRDRENEGAKDEDRSNFLASSSSSCRFAPPDGSGRLPQRVGDRKWTQIGIELPLGIATRV